MSFYSSPLRVLVFWMGTTGDALPFLGLSHAIARLGHEVTVFGNGAFRPTAEKLGLDFVDLITPEQYEVRLAERAQALDLESLKVNSKYVVEDLRPVHQAVHEHFRAGRTVVVSQAYLLGTRIAQEELDFPLATVHMYPMLLRSVYGGPAWIPKSLVRLGYRLSDIVIDAAIARPINELRRERGLPPVQRVMDRWCHSKDLVLGLFADWFVSPQRDWPPNTHVVGFPSFNPHHASVLSKSTETFLASGTPPVVFAHSAAVKLLDGFVEHSINATQAIGRRVLFLGLPPHAAPVNTGDVHSSPAEPHELLLPRSAGLVHHGGLGTAWAALRTGTPQVCVPQMLDQPFNANILRKLGVSVTMPWKKYRAAPLAKALRSLLTPETNEACRRYHLLAQEQPDACEAAAQLVDMLARTRLGAV